MGRQLKFQTLQNSLELEISSHMDVKPHYQYIHTTPTACALGYGLNREHTYKASKALMVVYKYV